MGRNAYKANPANSLELTKASAFTGSPVAQGIGVHKSVDLSIPTRAREAQRTTGENPGNAPNRGLTQAGVVEKFIAVTMGAASLTPDPSPLPSAFMPTGMLKSAKK
jgi:hypothetical protein